MTALLVLAVSLSGLTLTLAACGSDDSEATDDSSSAGEPLKIGVAGALSGEGAFADVPSRTGIEYAVEELNEEGGVDGHPIELDVKDMESDPQLAGVVTEELLEDGAAVLIGPPFPNHIVGVVQSAAKEDVTTVLPLLTDPSPAEVDIGTVAPVAFSDNQQGAAAAEYALDNGAETAVTVTSEDLTYTENLPAYFAETFENGGGEVIGDVLFSIGQSEFDSVARRVADSQPDVVYTAMYVPDTPVFLKALRAAGFDGPVYGADGWDSPALVEVGGDAAENTAFTTHAFPEPGSEVAEVMDGIRETQGKAAEAPAFAALGYDSVLVIKAAVEKAGSLDRAAITAAFDDLGTVEGVTGDITIEGPNQFPVKPVTVVEVDAGKFSLADQFIPQDVPPPR